MTNKDIFNCTEDELRQFIKNELDEDVMLIDYQRVILAIRLLECRSVLDAI